jgi:site-specific DNA-methyltransferase (adenine-specific)
MKLGELELNKIYCMDCLQGMKLMDDNTVDICITSPPYNIGKSVEGNKYKEYKDNLSQDEYYIFIKNVLTEIIRVTKHYVFLNFQILSTNKLCYLSILNDFKLNIKDIMIWHKKQFTPAISQTCLGSSFEFIIILSKKEKSINRTFERAFFNNREKGQLNSNVIYGNNMSCEKQFNKNNEENRAVFPEYLVKKLLNMFSKEHDIIFDPFMGSGTTAYVSKMNNRNFIGFDISRQYCDIADKRLQQDNIKQWIN